MSRVDMASAPAATIGSVVELDSLLRQLATGTLSETNVATSRLLDAAREEFVAHGIARTAVGDIARRAGVSRPTLYRKCGDKEDIVAAVLVRKQRNSSSARKQCSRRCPMRKTGWSKHSSWGCAKRHHRWWRR